MMTHACDFLYSNLFMCHFLLVIPFFGISALRAFSKLWSVFWIEGALSELYFSLEKFEFGNFSFLPGSKNLFFETQVKNCWPVLRSHDFGNQFLSHSKLFLAVFFKKTEFLTPSQMKI